MLACGEQSDGAFNGVSWLANEHRDWLDAQFARNEGSVGVRDANGKRVSSGFQAGEKAFQDFLVEARNRGGHSSLPRPDSNHFSSTRANARAGWRLRSACSRSLVFATAVSTHLM
jgi:hypothetical protein